MELAAGWCSGMCYKIYDLYIVLVLHISFSLLAWVHVKLKIKKVVVVGFTQTINHNAQNKHLYISSM
jgi:hypothetical protein